MKLRISRRAMDVLRQIQRGDDPYWFIHGMSAHGGMSRILGSLRRKGLIVIGDVMTLTDAGAAVLVDPQPQEEPCSE